MKSSFIIMTIASILLVPALFADTTGTGTTTSTGTTSTGVTSTGTTGTGTTGTGTTGTGTTGTGVNCMTGAIATASGNQAALLAAQQAFSTEIARLVGQKQIAYSGAQTLTGTARIDAMKSANIAFRTGFQTAIKALSSIKQANRSHHFDVRECRKEVKNKKHEEKKEHKEEIKSQIKDLQEKIKEIRKNNRDRASGQSSDRR